MKELWIFKGKAYSKINCSKILNMSPLLVVQCVAEAHSHLGNIKNTESLTWTEIVIPRLCFQNTHHQEMVGFSFLVLPIEKGQD